MPLQITVDFLYFPHQNFLQPLLTEETSPCCMNGLILQDTSHQQCHKVRSRRSLSVHSIKLLANFYIEHNLKYLLLVLLPKIASQGYEQNGCESTNTSSNFKPKIHCFTSAGLFFWQGNSFDAMLWLIPYIQGFLSNRKHQKVSCL